MNDDEFYEDLTNQQYLNARQLTVLCLGVLALIQTIPFIFEPTPWTEWVLLGYTAGVSTCAIVGAILVQHNADKITVLYKQAFNADFYRTINTLNDFRKELESDPEFLSTLPELFGLLKSYSHAQANPIQPPTIEELGITEPDPNHTEEELFS